MGYAPILDPSRYATFGRERERRVAVSAAAALQRIARDEAVLLRAVKWAGDKVPKDELRTLLSQLPAVETVFAETDIERAALLDSLINQLEQVKAFTELDNGRLEDHIGTVGRLIRSGRVELFAASPA